MKRLIAAALVICLLTCGCGVIHENNEKGKEVSVGVLDMSDNKYVGRVAKSAVYFLNQKSYTLTAELRTLDIDQNANPAVVAVEELLKGPSNDELIRVAPEGMSLDFIEYSRDIANVYLLYDGEEMLLKDKYVLELALANTITDILGATYICVFYNGVQTGYYNAPVAPQQKQTGSIEEEWSQAKGVYFDEVNIVEPEPEPDPEQPIEPILTDEYIEPEPIVSKISTVLYYISANGGYILPEVRIVEYTDGNYIEMLIEELQIGPQNTAIMTSPLAGDIELLESEFTKKDDGTYTLELDFSELPTQYDDSTEQDALLSYAAMIYTITGFVPYIKSIDIYVKGTKLTLIEGAEDLADGLQRDDYAGYIGSSAPLYFADTDSDLLLEVARSMEQEQIWSAKARVLEVMRGPLFGDGDNVETVLILGTSQADILSVDVYNDTAYVNLSQNFKDACIGISARIEMQLVYSIVNTVTAMDGITKVQFLIEGEQIDALAGYLCLSDAFLRNYGIIKLG